MTGLFVTVGDVTKTVRVRRRTINLDKVSKINMMSRDIADDKIDFEEALKRFEYIMAQKPYSLWVKTVAVALCCGFLRCCLAVMRLTDLIRLWSVRLSMFLYGF